MSTLHELLTDQGAYIHTHIEADFDDGDAENGPGPYGHGPFDLYEGDSHDIIVENGLIVNMIAIDWDLARFFEGLAEFEERNSVEISFGGPR